MESAGNVAVLHAAVEAFRNREIGYREILEELPAAIYTTDADGLITYYNKACIEFSGRTPTLGDDHWCVSWKLYTIDGEPLPHDQCPMAVALQERRSIRGIEAIAERPDGTRIHFLPYPTPIIDADGVLLGAVNMLVDISEQKDMQERLALLARELDHRANNLLAVMQSILSLTKAESVMEYRAALEGRFLALARANSLIADQRWTNVDLRSLVREELAPYSRHRVTVNGDTVRVSPPSAQSLGMLIHELCTNAVKYGALSAENGQVDVSWVSDRANGLVLTWREHGGPLVVEPAEKGTGSRVIAAVVRQFGGQITHEWKPTGLECTLRCQVDDL